ncbi:hypothetical protein [Brevibacterium sp. 'Marine']|uniref:hypothetical protein n=1 Tax=Brevibacterium sp. 'Marine' TaxID=2725563 RepID=UPI0032B81166
MEEAHAPSLRRHAAGGKGAEIACGQFVPSTGDRCLSAEGRSGQLAAGVLAAEELLDDEFDVVEVELSFADELEDSFEEESELEELTVLDLLERESVA